MRKTNTWTRSKDGSGCRWNGARSSTRSGSKEERKRDVADALYFRNYRRSLFPAADAKEDALEMNEGMAEYTGFKLSTSSPEEYAVAVAAWLRAAPTRTPSYGRSFAYTSGPAYGGLLDTASKDWRKGLTPATDRS